MRTSTVLFLLVYLNSASAQPGTVDTTFHSQLMPGNGNINCVLALPNGKAMIGGSFATYDGMATGGIGRLLADGSLDLSFVGGAGFDNEVYCMLRLVDGRILVGGAFNTYGGDRHTAIGPSECGRRLGHQLSAGGFRSSRGA